MTAALRDHVLPRRPKPLDCLLVFLADQASPLRPERIYVNARPSSRIPYEIHRIPCRRGMASALRRHVCGGSNKSNSSRNQLISLRTGHGQTRLRSPTSMRFVRNKHVLWHEPWRGGKRRTASDKQNDCLLGKRRKRIWTSI